MARKAARPEGKGVPDELCSHKFTEDEKFMLENGMMLRVDDFVSKKSGKTFSCRCSYDPDEGKVQFHFD